MYERTCERTNIYAGRSLYALRGYNNAILEDKFIGLVLNIANKNILLVNVYIKSDQWVVGTHDASLDYLSQLEFLIMSHQFDGIYFLGDFNAVPFTGRAWGKFV